MWSVLAFSHAKAGSYNGVDVPSELAAYATPLGNVALDREVCDQLLKHPLFSSHPGMHRWEHSLELQIPFLQRTLKDFQLVPLLVGRMTDDEYAQAAAAIKTRGSMIIHCLWRAAILPTSVRGLGTRRSTGTCRRNSVSWRRRRAGRSWTATSTASVSTWTRHATRSVVAGRSCSCCGYFR